MTPLQLEKLIRAIEKAAVDLDYSRYDDEYKARLVGARAALRKYVSTLAEKAWKYDELCK